MRRNFIDKLIEAREIKGLSQRYVSEMRGVKQLAKARLESMRATLQIDILFKVLNQLGYTLSIIPVKNSD